MGAYLIEGFHNQLALQVDQLQLLCLMLQPQIGNCPFMKLGES
jgi:hypothetical protein